MLTRTCWDTHYVYFYSISLVSFQNRPETTLKLLHQLNLHKHLIRVVPFTHWVPSATMSLLQSTLWHLKWCEALIVVRTDLLIQMLFWWKSSFVFQDNLQNFERLSRDAPVAPPGVVGAFLDIFPFIYLFDYSLYLCILALKNLWILAFFTFVFLDINLFSNISNFPFCNHYCEMF